MFRIGGSSVLAGQAVCSPRSARSTLTEFRRAAERQADLTTSGGPAALGRDVRRQVAALKVSDVQE